MTLAVTMAVSMVANVPANAQDFTGSTIRATYESPTVGIVIDGPTNAVVGSGIEFANINGLSIDFTLNSLVVTDLSGDGFGTGAFNGLHFFDVNSTTPSITGLTQTGFTAGFSPIATFDANNIFLNFSDIDGGAANRSVSYNVSFAQATAAVPEPASWAMMMLGIGAVGVTMRCRSKVTKGVRFV